MVDYGISWSGDLMPFKDPEKKRAYNKKYAETYYERNRDAVLQQQRTAYHKGDLKRSDRPQASNRTYDFVGCDGEGYTNENGYHAYNMFRMGDALLTPREGDIRLRTLDILEFICAQPPDAIYVGYFFDYDTTKILEDLSQYKLDRLVHRELRKNNFGGHYPVDFYEYEIEYFPKKELKVRKCQGSTTDSHTGRAKKTFTPWITISDVGTFFQCSFVKALTQWSIGTESIRQAIAATKNLRSSFAKDDFAKIAEYNRQECILLAQLMEKFRDTCVDLDVIPKKWQGPGQLVEAKLAQQGIPKSRDVPMLTSADNNQVLEFARNAYYGGRFEVSRVGNISTQIYQYDINSAYPFAMTEVPCLNHGRWYHGSKSDAQRPLSLCYGTFSAQTTDRSSFYGLPMRRKDGSIFFPASGKGWYWSFEITSSKHQIFEPETVWYYATYCDCKPLGFVKDMYEERLRVGKTDKGMAIKLIMNSIYGKMVQSIGMPKYSNAIWGSFLTAKTRTQIQDFLHGSPACKRGLCGHDVAMIATDSVASLRERPDVKPSKTLGGWDLEMHPSGMFIVQSGIYFGTSGKASKTRGLPTAQLDSGLREQFVDAFERLKANGRVAEATVPITKQAFVGLKLALARRNMKLLGQWIDAPSEVSFNWKSKRDASVKPGMFSSDHFVLAPYKGSPDVCTVPYDKDIGGLFREDVNRQMMDDQPDWSPAFESSWNWND